MKVADWITRQRQLTTDLLATAAELDEQRRSWDALNLSAEIDDDDFDGENEGITAAEMTAAVVSAEAVRNLLNQGHSTNFYKVSF